MDSPSSTVNTLAWISLTTGILSLVMFMFAPLSIPLAIVSVILGIVARKSKNRLVAWISVALALIAIILTALMFLFLVPVHTGAVFTSSNQIGTS